MYALLQPGWIARACFQRASAPMERAGVILSLDGACANICVVSIDGARASAVTPFSAPPNAARV
eukprot:5930797-Lingulodinium_polyedra.AAC.1